MCVEDPSLAAGFNKLIVWDFETDEGWTFDNSGTDCGWSVTDAPGVAQSGTKGLYYGNVATLDYACGLNSGTAVSPFVELPAGAFSLRFAIYLSVEDTPAYDQIRVSWLTTSTAPQVVWQKTNHPQGEFLTIEAELPTSTTGQPGQVEIVFDTIDGSANATLGVVIDDVAIGESGCPGEPTDGGLTEVP